MNYFLQIKSVYRKAIFIFLMVVLPIAVVWAINTWDTGYRVNNAQTKNVYYSSAQICKKVTNNSGTDIYVPTKTTPEWNAFSANKPSGVSIASCQICTPGQWDGNTGYVSTCSRTCNGSVWGPGETHCIYRKCNSAGTGYVNANCKCGATCTAPNCSGGVCSHSGYYNNCPTNPGCS